ncbi:MAG: LuxR C-terminal-related transcriptional regulator [Bacteroidota bacterium]
MSVHDVLIATKFHVPAASPDVMPRSRLFQLLDKGMHLPLTLVCAPPGFGKTVLVADWIHAQHQGDALRIGWLSIDENDSRPGVFWQYFVAALQDSSPGASELAREMLAAPVPPDAQSILGRLINQLAAERTPILIILDDYHLIRSPEIHAGLGFFLDHLPANVHLILLTREDPPLGLARRRARRQVVEIRAVDLRFELQETIQFLNETCKLGLTPGQVEVLEQRTEGWIAGLQMAALSLKGRDTLSFLESFSGDDRYIADYLIEEVLQLQEDAVRRFLLITSILDRLSVQLCGVLFGDALMARSMLDYLEHANLFLVPLDNHREWYRYHHLFRDLLRQRLGESSPTAEIEALNRAASVWFEEQGDVTPAVQHALQIPDTGRAIRLLQVHSGNFFANNQLPMFLELVHKVPVEQIKVHPSLCMAIAWASLAINEAEGPWLGFVEDYYHRKAESVFTDEEIAPDVRAALLEVLILRQQRGFEIFDRTKQEYLLALQRQLDSLSVDQSGLFNTTSSLKPVIQFDLGLEAEQSGDVNAAVRYLTKTITLARADHNYHLLYLCLAHLASTQICQGHLQAARQTYEQALALYTSGSASPFAAVAHAGLSSLYYEWGELETAEEHLMKGLPLSESWNNWESLIPLKMTQAHLEARRGNVQKAIAILDVEKTPPFPGMGAALEAYAILLRLREADRGSVEAWLAANVPDPTLEATPANEFFLLDVARILTGLTRFEDAIALTQRIIRFAEKGGRTHTLIQAKAVLARALAFHGNMQAGIDCLLEALQLAAPEQYVSTFVDEGQPIRDLLRLVKAQPPSRLCDYVDRILTGFGEGQNQPVKPASGPRPELSEREQEVLALVAEGLSNQEIGGRLVISVTTVKTHVGNIFNKLGVTSRTQAIARATELGLLPHS